MPSPSTRYAIISPVKDEEPFVRATLESVSRQTILPARWIVVDDGSHDRTAEIVAEYASHFPWIAAVRTPGGVRQPGAAVIRAFNYGFEELGGFEALAGGGYDFIVKLDCDLRLERDYFQKLLSRFEEDPKLGIASGVYREMRRGNPTVVGMPPYHAAGASKMVRAACFRDIGGFISERGWDTVDEIRAQVHGWRTAHFKDAVMDHLKPEGIGIGRMRTHVMLGEIAYRTGSGGFFFLAKAAARIVRGRPLALGGLAMLWGFARAVLFRKPRLVNPREARHYRSLLNQRIATGLRHPFVRFFSFRIRPFWRFS